MYQLSVLPRIITADETLTVIREDTQVDAMTTYVDGKPVKLGFSTFTVTANVQPMSGKDLMLVPEGDRSKDQYWVYATPAAMALQLNDKIHRKGVVYQVQSVQGWECYYQARIMAIDVIDQTPGGP